MRQGNFASIGGQAVKIRPLSDKFLNIDYSVDHDRQDIYNEFTMKKAKKFVEFLLTWEGK